MTLSSFSYNIFELSIPTLSDTILSSLDCLSVLAYRSLILSSCCVCISWKRELAR